MRKRNMGVVPVGRGGPELAAAAKLGELNQQIDESDAQYALFLTYCQADPSQTLEDIANQAGTSTAWISRLRKTWNWDERIIDWRVSRKQPGEVVVPEDGDWARRRDLMRQREWEAQERALELCNRSLERWRCSEELPSLGEITKLLELASKLGRIASGLPLSQPETEPEKPTFRIDIEAALARAYGHQKPAVATVEAAACRAEVASGEGEVDPNVQSAGNSSCSNGPGSLEFAG